MKRIDYRHFKGGNIKISELSKFDVIKMGRIRESHNERDLENSYHGQGEGNKEEGRGRREKREEI
jgi:hypothetical protein